MLNISEHEFFLFLFQGFNFFYFFLIILVSDENITMKVILSLSPQKRKIFFFILIWQGSILPISFNFLLKLYLFQLTNSNFLFFLVSFLILLNTIFLLIYIYNAWLLEKNENKKKVIFLQNIPILYYTCYFIYIYMNFFSIIFFSMLLQIC